MIHTRELYRDTYVDSVVQLAGTRALRAVDGVDWAAAAMATPANLETLAGEGFDAGDSAARGERPVRRGPRGVDEDAVAAGRGRPARPRCSPPASAGRRGRRAAAPHARRGARRERRTTNVAVISVPGDYAALEAHKALSAGLDVLLFSDNVLRRGRDRAQGRGPRGSAGW